MFGLHDYFGACDNAEKTYWWGACGRSELLTSDCWESKREHKETRVHLALIRVYPTALITPTSSTTYSSARLETKLLANTTVSLFWASKALTHLTCKVCSVCPKFLIFNQKCTTGHLQ